VLGKHWYLRFLAPFYPVLMFYAVLATAKNWVLDCLVGAVVTLAGWNLNWVMLLFRPVEEIVFFVLGIERPKEDEPEQVEERREYHLVRGQWVLV